MSSRRRFKTSAIVLTAALAGSALAACSGGSSGPSPSAGGAVKADASFGHVHGIVWDGDAILIGTHRGLWRQNPGAAPERVSGDAFDAMGLARTGDVLLASGHPAPGQNAPANLGLIESKDGGRTWETVSLAGEVDFHRLVAAGSTVMGVNSGDGTLRRSTDMGRTWEILGRPDLYDLALDPRKPTVVVGTATSGLVRSTNGGTGFTPVPGAPPVALASWGTSGLFGVADDGQVFKSSDGAVKWNPVGSVADMPTALAVEGERVAVVVGEALLVSGNGGRTFTERIVGLPRSGH